jgi:hypothetical protein
MSFRRTTEDVPSGDGGAYNSSVPNTHFPNHRAKWILLTMPARTNEFQDLVSLIESTLAPRGAKVKSSAEVAVFGLTTTREVDVLIQGPYGPYTMKVAVEAKDESRKIDIGTFDALLAKYRGECRVLVDKFVIVSRSGFTKGVVEKAAKVDVELLTLNEAKTKDWSNIGPAQFSFRQPPHICRITFLPPITVGDQRELWEKGRLICRHGHDHGSPMKRAKCLVFHQLLPSRPELQKDFARYVEQSPDGQGVLTVKCPHEGFKVSFRGQEYPVAIMAVQVHAVMKQGSACHTVLSRQSSSGGSRFLHYIKGSAGGMEMSVLIPHGPVPPPKIGLQFRRTAESRTAGTKKKPKRSR